MALVDIPGTLLRQHGLFTNLMRLVSSGGICLGPATNNMAEYHAFIRLLTQASSLGIYRIIVYLDSQLVVYQLNRIYAIHSPILLRLHLQVRCLE
jgi:ribonuclease HI